MIATVPGMRIVEPVKHVFSLGEDCSAMGLMINLASSLLVVHALLAISFTVEAFRRTGLATASFPRAGLISHKHLVSPRLQLHPASVHLRCSTSHAYWGIANGNRHAGLSVDHHCVIG